jgi:hypothetical protein
MPDTKLFRLDADLSAALDELDAEFLANLQAVLRALRQKVNALVRQMARERGRIVSTQVNLGIAQQAEAQLRQTMLQAGLADTVAQAYSHLPKLLAFTDISTKALLATEFNVNTLEAFRVLKVTELGDFSEALVGDIRGIVMRGVFGAQSEQSLIAEMEQVIEDSAAHASTIYDTALSEFVQTSKILGADNTPDEAWLYAGPIDNRIRPFCLARVGRVFSRAEIDQWDNGQLPNPMITRGGYNCRHQLHRIPKISDLHDLVDTGDFTSEQTKAEVERAATAIAAHRRPMRKAA